MEGATATHSSAWLARLMHRLTGRDAWVWWTTIPELTEDDLTLSVEFEGPHFLYIKPKS